MVADSSSPLLPLYPSSLPNFFLAELLPSACPPLAPASISPRNAWLPVTEKILQRDPMEDLRRAFGLFDDDQTGKISLKNLRRVAKELGESLGEEEL